ncbi:MAG: hypothetical protein MK240_03445 [Opitutales bacterium]|nr:hypothetical protein [Opitutales bacterium]
MAANGDEQLDTEEMRRTVRALEPKEPREMWERGHHYGDMERTEQSNMNVECIRHTTIAGLSSATVFSSRREEL